MAYDQRMYNNSFLVFHSPTNWFPDWSPDTCRSSITKLRHFKTFYSPFWSYSDCLSVKIGIEFFTLYSIKLMKRLESTFNEKILHF